MRLNEILAGTASLLALVAAVPAAAQEAPAAPAEDNDAIVVTGIRASQRQSIEAKRELGVISDVITAEDIGKFPDKNVAEALQRVPGIVINREFGEGERVSLRGTAPNLTKTLVNGHAIATADWFILDQLAATRSFNYLTLPAEIVGKLEVFKSPQADVEEGGIGGTINVNTRNPLDLKAFSISASAQMVYTQKADSWDPQVSGLFSWKNADETFGVLIGGVYQKRNVRRDGVEVLGYFNGTGDPGGDALIPSMIGSALFEQERERYGGNIGIQFRPSDRLEVNVTGLYSKFNANNFNQNYIAWGIQALGGGGRLSNPTIGNGIVTKGRIDSAVNASGQYDPAGRAVVYDAIDRAAFAETWSGDIDVKWKPSDRGTLHFKAGYTKASGDTKSQPFYEGGAPGAFTFDLTGKTPKVSFIGIDPTRPNDLVFDFGSFHQISNDDKEKYAYLDYEQEVDWGVINAIKVGAKYVDHTRRAIFNGTTFGGFFVPLAATGCGGRACTSADFAGGLTPDDFLDGIAGSGTLDRYWQVDRRKLREIYSNLPANVRQRVLNPPENYSINEKSYGGYVMAKFGGDNWRGNAGVRIVRTDQTSRGNLIGVVPGPGTVNDNPFGVYQPITAKRSYTDILPSFNISFDLDPTLVLRFAAARAMARPDYTDIVPRFTLNPGALTASGGDPGVDPYRANQFDLSLEWYPDKNTIIAGALFYKDIQSYVVDALSQERFPVQTNTPNLERCTRTPGGAAGLYDCIFDVNRRSNGPGGRNQGFELQLSRQLWGGFGVVANYTYSDAKIKGGARVPGNSKHSLNLTGYFENDLLSARLSWNYRSKFYIGIDRGVSLDQAATSSLDGSLAVNVTENIALTADAINLTNEKIEQFSITPDRPRGIYANGRQIYLGARFRF